MKHFKTLIFPDKQLSHCKKCQSQPVVFCCTEDLFEFKPIRNNTDQVKTHILRWNVRKRESHRSQKMNVFVSTFKLISVNWIYKTHPKNKIANVEIRDFVLSGLKNWNQSKSISAKIISAFFPSDWDFSWPSEISQWGETTQLVARSVLDFSLSDRRRFETWVCSTLQSLVLTKITEEKLKLLYPLHLNAAAALLAWADRAGTRWATSWTPPKPRKKKKPGRTLQKNFFKLVVKAT